MRPAVLCPRCNTKLKFLDQYQETGTYWCPSCGSMVAETPSGVRLNSTPKVAHMYADLKDRLKNSHLTMCTRENCKLDGGPEHEEAFTGA